jgi:hypothetical protein
MSSVLPLPLEEQSNGSNGKAATGLTALAPGGKAPSQQNLLFLELFVAGCAARQFCFL